MSAELYQAKQTRKAPLVLRTALKRPAVRWPMRAGLVLAAGLLLVLDPAALAYPVFGGSGLGDGISATTEHDILVARRRRRRHRRSTQSTSRRRRRKNKSSNEGKTTKEPFKLRQPKELGGGSAFPESSRAAAPSSEAAPPVASGALRRGARVEFDSRLVQGQTAKSGAIYLFARKRSELRSMVEERTNYRKELLSTIYTTHE